MCYNYTHHIIIVITTIIICIGLLNNNKEKNIKRYIEVSVSQPYSILSSSGSGSSSSSSGGSKTNNTITKFVNIYKSITGFLVVNSL